jgi:hypothetical protein
MNGCLNYAETQHGTHLAARLGTLAALNQKRVPDAQNHRRNKARHKQGKKPLKAHDADVEPEADEVAVESRELDRHEVADNLHVDACSDERVYKVLVRHHALDDGNKTPERCLFIQNQKKHRSDSV